MVQSPAYTPSSLLQRLRDDGVKFLRLQFSDIDGQTKNVEVPESQFDKAVEGRILFDGSSVHGFSRIQESDMQLRPDLDTYIVFPWEEHQFGRVARLICDVVNPDGSPFEGCPRSMLKRAIAHATRMGFQMVVGPEAEFFLFERNPDGSPTVRTHDAAGYFDQTPVDRGEECRRDIVEALVQMGFEVEAAHHEVAPGQHEIDFRYGDALRTADNLLTFKMAVRKIALDHNLHATFMPKPIHGVNGSGMHCHQSLFYLDTSKGAEGSQGNSFFDPKAPRQMSQTCMHYIGGLLAHARNFCAVTNPLVNSYKRILPGYEAPINLAWSLRNRSPLIRIPDRRGVGTRVELRQPDPSCNPYLAFAVMLRSGLDGIERKLNPGEPIEANIFEMSDEEKAQHNIKPLPGDLREAVECLESDALVKDALGSHITEHLIHAKRKEWQTYIAQVHAWEINRYLARY